MIYSKTKYIKMLNSVNNADTDTNTEILTDLLNQLGIQNADETEHKLIIWNDHVNNMIDVIMALYEICHLSPEDAQKVMLEAHTKGKAVVKTGSLDELQVMKKGLNDRNLEATIEQ
jgi:ATP-dependent Clp protease adaptor protein ClpS